jgi:glycosyltransferase involved in cell wall biosynthesis
VSGEPVHPQDVIIVRRGLGRRTGGIHVIAGRRILFVVNVDWFFLSHRIPLAVSAMKSGADVWVAAVDTGRSQGIKETGAHFVNLNMSRKGGGVVRELATFIELATLYRRLRPDLVHQVTIKPVLYGSIISGILRIPTVNAISGFGHVFGASRSRALRWSIETFYRLALRNSRSFTIFQNEEDREEFIRRGFIAESRAFLVRGSGVDCEMFRPAEGQHDELVVMFASRMLREKGVGYFVEAARTLRPDYPHVRFVLVGEPDESPTSVTIAELEAWHGEGVVEWWGRRDDMDVVIPKASLFVLPTYYREGLPKVLLEAAACGVAIITTDIPGCRDVVKHGKSGILVLPHDQVGLMTAMRELIEDGSARRRLGVQARESAVEQFNVRGVVKTTLSMYDQLLDE